MYLYKFFNLILHLPNKLIFLLKNFDKNILNNPSFLKTDPHTNSYTDRFGTNDLQCFTDLRAVTAASITVKFFKH